MINLTCKKCGSNHFIENKNNYVCEYCHTTIIKPPSTSNKRLKIIITLLILILVGGYMVYKLLYSVKKEINHLQQTHSQTKISPVIYGNNEKNPFSSLIQQVESSYKQNNNENSLEKVIKRYHMYESNKAFYLALTADGTYVYGISYAVISSKKAEDLAFKSCEKNRKLQKIKELCIPYAVNNHISRLLINTQ